MHPLQGLTKLLKSLGVDTRQAIVGLIVVGLISAYGGLLYLSKVVLNYSILLLTTPTPLWATISLVLLGYGYIYLIFHRSYSSAPLSDKIEDSQVTPVSSDGSKTSYFTLGEHKWKADVYPRNRRGSDLKIELLTRIGIFAILCHGEKTPN